jgi:hypothetical protein
MLALVLSLVLATPAVAPGRLSETGYGDPRNAPFAPQYPLWTDGAAKSRWILLPEGATIDTTDPDHWIFPVGTKLWKEFAFGGRKVETRLSWRASETDWVFATYVWNEAQTEAVLAPEAGVRNAVEIAPGKRHSIPGSLDCRVCHESGPDRVLGFNAIQLSDDRDPLAPHAEPLRPELLTLRSLVESGRLVPDRREWVERPPRIDARSPVERAALGYLSGNCGHCHNAKGSLAHLGLVLAHETAAGSAPVLASAVDVPGRFPVPGVAADASRRVAPGDPSASAVAYRMRSRRPSSQMPPVGTVLADDEAVRLVEAWIAQLSGQGQGFVLGRALPALSVPSPPSTP